MVTSDILSLSYIPKLNVNLIRTCVFLQKALDPTLIKSEEYTREGYLYLMEKSKLLV